MSGCVLCDMGTRCHIHPEPRSPCGCEAGEFCSVCRYVAPQPTPQAGTAHPTWECVIADLRATAALRGGDPAVWHLVADDGVLRDAQGRLKYKTPHRVDNGRDHAVDAYQEALDGVVYAYAEAEKSGWGEQSKRLFQASLDLAYLWRSYLHERDRR